MSITSKFVIRCCADSVRTCCSDRIAILRHWKRSVCSELLSRAIPQLRYQRCIGNQVCNKEIIYFINELERSKIRIHLLVKKRKIYS